MHQYKVTEPCYYGGVYRTPTNKHRIVTLQKKLSEKAKPRYLEYMEEVVPEVPELTKEEKAAAELAAQAEIDAAKAVAQGT